MQTLVFKTTLNPTSAQATQLASHVGAVRFSYNWALAHIQANWEAVKTNPEVEYVNTSAYSLRKELNLVKEEIAPWWDQNSKEAFATGTANASRALTNWHRGRKTGKPVGFPRFKTKYHDTNTGINFTTGVLRLEDTLKHFTVPRIGKIRLFEKQKTLKWLLSQGGKISQTTISKQGTKWFIAINVKVEDNLALQYFNGRYKKKTRTPAVGLDVGLKVFLTGSDGNIVENPAFLRKSLTKLRKANKRLARRRKLNKQTGEVASGRWDKAHRQVVKTHAKISNQRTDFLHKTSKQLVENNQIIGVETLSIKNMVKNRHLSLSISDAGWGEFTRQLAYKAARYGGQLIKIDPFYPSSKTCSKCLTVKTKLLLSTRTFKCDNCGLSIDRDLNAAINIRNQALLVVAQSCGETLNERGGTSTGLPVMVNETSPSETLSGSIEPQPI